MNYPVHEDDKASLSLTETADGKVLMHCFAGCDSKDIVQAIGLELKDLFPDNGSTNGNSKLVSEYVYRGLDGDPKLKVLRYQPKTFKQQLWSQLFPEWWC